MRNYSSQATSTLKELITKEKFDVIHAETFYIMPHILETDTPILLVEQTIEFKVYQHYVNSLPFFIRPLFSMDIIKLKYWERYYWRKAFLVGAVSESDRMTITGLEPSIKPVIIPNGAGEEMIVDKLEAKKLNYPVLLFVGIFSGYKIPRPQDISLTRFIHYSLRQYPLFNLSLLGKMLEIS